MNGDQIAKICPELVEKSPYDEKYYWKVEQVVLVLVSQLQGHNRKLEDCQYQLMAQDDEIQELRNKCQKLSELIDKLQEIA